MKLPSSLITTAKSIAVRHEALTSAILLLSPIAPHICHSLWKTMGNRRRLQMLPGQSWMSQRWCAALSRLVIQVNGKVRGKIQVAADAPKDEVEKLALEDSNVQRFHRGRRPFEKLLWFREDWLI